MELDYLPFRADDLREYRGWFTDARLIQHLSPAPEALWLDDVISHERGFHVFRAMRSGECVAVVGISPDEERRESSTLDELAVNPTCRRQGVGRQVVEDVCKWDGWGPRLGGLWWIATISR